MGYDERLAARVRDALTTVKRVTEREMFGELAFMVAGNVCCAVLDDDLVVHLDPDLYHDALTRPHAHETSTAGRAARGVVYVDADGLADDAELDLWVRLGLARARSLPPKAVKRRRTTRAAGASTPHAPARKAKKPAVVKKAAVKKPAVVKKAAVKKPAAVKKAAATKKPAVAKKAPRKKPGVVEKAAAKKPATGKRAAKTKKPAATRR